METMSRSERAVGGDRRCRRRRRRGVSASQTWRGGQVRQGPNSTVLPHCKFMQDICMYEKVSTRPSISTQTPLHDYPPTCPPLRSPPPAYCVYLSMYKDDVILHRTRSHSVPPGTRQPPSHPVCDSSPSCPCSSRVRDGEWRRTYPSCPVCVSVCLSLQSPLFLRDFRRQSRSHRARGTVSEPRTHPEPSQPALRFAARALTFP